MGYLQRLNQFIFFHFPALIGSTMSNIHLTFSSSKAWDATYRTPEGQVVYKVESAMPLLGARTIKISKIMPTFLDNRITTKGREAEYLRDSFAHLATVEYHTFRSSRIRMGSLNVATSDYFRREGWSLTTLGRSVIFKLWGRNNISQL